MKLNDVTPVVMGLLLIGLSGCASNGDGSKVAATPEPIVVVEPEPLKHKFPHFEPNYNQAAADAQLAINNKDVALWTESRRGVGIIGFANQDSHQVEQYCGLKYLPQSSDILESRQPISWNKVREYANRYNSIVLPACLAKIAQNKG
ncbi:hypothetical protein QX776_13770 [Alteromonadaceae bacterium BrNp21-10]|nr:hypothetical protein [Alteromonadaceae bacterium BrNp21-10]